MTVADLLRDALLEIAVYDPVEDVSPQIQALALLRLNSILDLWNAKREATYTVTYPTFTTTDALSPHTIGPSGATWTVSTQRPMEILAANRILSSGTSLARIPLNIRDQQWWINQPTPNIEDGIPTDLYYSPSWPNGSVYLWPVPNAAFTMELQVRTILGQLATADDFSLPPGYQRALTLTLAEDLTSPLSVPLSVSLVQKGRDARSAIFGANDGPVRIVTRDAGMPSAGTRSGGFNWRTGTGGGR